MSRYARVLLDRAVCERRLLQEAETVAEHLSGLGRGDRAVVAGIVLALDVSVLAACRLRFGLTAEQAVDRIKSLAKESGRKVRVSVADLDRWESGVELVPPRLLTAVCAALRVSPDQIGYTDHSEEPTPPAGPDTAVRGTEGTR